MSKVRGANPHLKLGEENGKSLVRVLDEKGSTKFNGNSPVTIDQLLEEAYKPYLKKSEGSTSTRQVNNPTETRVQQNGHATRQGARTTVE